jgi:hypothetical protein
MLPLASSEISSKNGKENLKSCGTIETLEKEHLTSVIRHKNFSSSLPA